MPEISTYQSHYYPTNAHNVKYVELIKTYQNYGGCCNMFRFTEKPSSGSHSQYVWIHPVQNVFLRCPTPRIHCFLSSHWSSFRFLSLMAFFIPSIQLFFGLPRALFCFDIHFNAILGSLSSAILWTWPYHVSWLCSISKPQPVLS